MFLRLHRDLDYLCQLSAAGQLTPVIDGPYGLGELPGAMRHFAEGKHQGKVVISLEGSP